jgi:hypothetical protein
MTVTRLRPAGALLLATIFAVVLGVVSALPPGLALQVEKFIGGTSMPDPTVGGYMDLVQARFLTSSPLFSGQTTFPDSYTFHGLHTPEEFWPVFGSLKFADSLAQGVSILDSTIRPLLQAGDNVAVLGFSQSATITTLELNNLVANPPGGFFDPANLHLVLLGDPNNPIGGMLTRLHFSDGVAPFTLDGAPQHLPFLNVPLGIGPTLTGPFPTDVYTGEYDGWANFPQDPLNLLAVLNALIGIGTVHSDYPVFDLADTINLGSIDATNFYMIPGQLPILWPLYQVPYVLPVFAEAIAPGLKLAIDWGYGNPGDPGAGFAIGGVDPIGVAGPWAVTASGHLSDISGVAGFMPRMDPLQMLAGLQYAGVQSLLGGINEILREAGQQPLPDTLANALLGGYHLTNGLDQLLLTGWNDVATGLNLAELLGPDAVFNGAPLIPGQPVLDLVGLGFSVFNFFGA